MTYVMEKELIEKINAQRAEAIEFSKQPGCWMGMYVEPSDTKYWSERVPSGTLKEFNRINLEEDAYYAVADAYSKSYARSFDFASLKDAEIEKIFDDALGEAKRGMPMIGIYNSSNSDNSYGIRFDKMRRELPSK